MLWFETAAVEHIHRKECPSLFKSPLKVILGEHTRVLFVWSTLQPQTSAVASTASHTPFISGPLALCTLTDSTPRCFKRFCRIAKDSVLMNIMDLSLWLHKDGADPTWRCMNYELLLAHLQGDHHTQLRKLFSFLFTLHKEVISRSTSVQHCATPIRHNEPSE